MCIVRWRSDSLSFFIGTKRLLQIFNPYGGSTYITLLKHHCKSCPRIRSHIEKYQACLLLPSRQRRLHSLPRRCRFDPINNPSLTRASTASSDRSACFRPTVRAQLWKAFQNRHCRENLLAERRNHSGQTTERSDRMPSDRVRMARHEHTRPAEAYSFVVQAE